MHTVYNKLIIGVFISYELDECIKTIATFYISYIYT